MFIGPVFTREVTIAPRRDRTYIARGIYGALLLLLISTAWLVMTGTQVIIDTGDFSRFGASLFGILAPLQMVIMLFLSAILAAAAVAQEKDRKTLLLLLLTHLSNSELVLGKLLASLLEVLTFLVISLPIFMLISLLGGISYPQIVRVLLVTFFAVLTCGSVGSCIALWRDKTFQAIAGTTLVLVLWIGVWQAIGFLFPEGSILGIGVPALVTAMSPWQAVLTATQPAIENDQTIWGILNPISGYLLSSAVITLLINGTAIAMVRIWNPSRELKQGTPEEDTWRKEAVAARLQREAAERKSAVAGQVFNANPYESLTDNLLAQEEEHPDLAQKEEYSADGRYKMDAAISAAPGKVREVWDNPIIWREICTHAYGRKTFIIRLVYFLLFAMSIYALHLVFSANQVPLMSDLAGPLVPFFVLSMLLLNAQSVTSLTSERDGGTFNLLLVSDISPKEFVYGKLGGSFYNMKEAILFPLLICGYIIWKEPALMTNMLLLTGGLIVLYFFAAMVGVHIGMQYSNTRSAVAASLGIIFFLFIGIATCMWIMIAFSGSFEAQLQPFLAFVIGGSIGLYICLGARNPSAAIASASFVCPLATFYAITSLLLGKPYGVFVSIVGAYLFASIAMLIPAVDEFDVATGRTTAD